MQQNASAAAGRGTAAGPARCCPLPPAAQLLTSWGACRSTCTAVASRAMSAKWAGGIVLRSAVNRQRGAARSWGILLSLRLRLRVPQNHCNNGPTASGLCSTRAVCPPVPTCVAQLRGQRQVVGNALGLHRCGRVDQQLQRRRHVRRHIPPCRLQHGGSAAAVAAPGCQAAAAAAAADSSSSSSAATPAALPPLPASQQPSSAAHQQHYIQLLPPQQHSRPAGPIAATQQAQHPPAAQTRS